jgi:hypothetical protein
LVAFAASKRLGLTGDFSIACRIYELVGQQTGNQVRIICLLRLKPLLFQCRYSFLGPTRGTVVLRQGGAPQ